MMLGSVVEFTPKNSLEDLYDLDLGVAPNIAIGCGDLIQDAYIILASLYW